MASERSDTALLMGSASAKSISATQAGITSDLYMFHLACLRERRNFSSSSNPLMTAFPVGSDSDARNTRAPFQINCLIQCGTRRHPLRGTCCTRLELPAPAAPGIPARRGTSISAPPPGMLYIPAVWKVSYRLFSNLQRCFFCF